MCIQSFYTRGFSGHTSRFQFIGPTRRHIYRYTPLNNTIKMIIVIKFELKTIENKFEL